MNIFYVGEKKAVYASFTSVSTITVSSAYFSLYLDDTLLLGNLAASGFDAPGTTVRAWYDLDASALVPGDYVALFTVDITGADGIGRTIEQPVPITVQDPAEQDN